MRVACSQFPSRAQLSDPGAFFANHAQQMVILDEVQRMPDLFAVLRGVIDQRRRAGAVSGRFLLPGSARNAQLMYSDTTFHLPSTICDRRAASLPMCLVGEKLVDGLPKMSGGVLMVSITLAKLSVVRF